MNKTPQQTADEIFNEYYNWVKIISYTIESDNMIKAIAKDMSLLSVNFTLNSHNTKDEIIFWGKVHKIIKNKS
jgi:hypothetical protein